MTVSRAIPVALLVATAGCAGLRTAAPPTEPARPPQTFALTGAAVAIYDPAGSVRIQPGTGDHVLVTVTRAGADAESLRPERVSRAGGDLLRLQVSGPAPRRLLYPGMPGRSDSVQFRATRSGYAAGRGGFLGLFGGRTTKVLRRPGKAPATDAHADMVVSVPPGRRVDLQVGAGDIFVAGDVGEVHAQSAAGDFTLSSAGGRIFVSAASGTVSSRGGSGELTLTSRAGSVDLVGFAGQQLQATTSAGSIRATSTSAGVLRLRTGAGVIELDSVRGGSVELRSGAGRIAARDLAADTVRADAGVGSLALVALRARLVALRTHRGDVLAGLVAVPEELRAKADGGAMLDLPPGAAADLSLASEHGRISVDAGATSGSGPTPRTSRKLVTRLGAGGGRIEVHAEHDITVRVDPPEAAEAVR